MELKNKKVLFLGDSITAGTGVSSPEKCYVSVFGKISDKLRHRRNENCKTVR